MHRYDVCVIGAGAGGLSAAAGLAQLGMDVVLIEKGAMGGDCLNTGCIPSKALLKAAKMAQTTRDGGPYGIKPQEPEVDFTAVKDHVQGVIDSIAPHDSVERFEGLGVTVIQDSARFLDAHTVQAGNKKIKAKYFIIATGSRASVPPIKGLDKTPYFTNETIFDLCEKPDHLLIIGGGPVGIEMAQAHRRLGSKVSVLDIGSILLHDDRDLVMILHHQLQAEAIDIHENIQIKEIKNNAVILKDGTTFKGSHILIAAGRRPNIEALNLDQAGIAFNKKGITVDARLRTNHKHIFAVGDVCGGPQFTHIAGYQAGVVLQNIAFKLPAKVDYTALPWVTYCDPELAQVGHTEESARAQFGDNIEIISWDMTENDRARTERHMQGRIKVIARKGRIIGASIIATHAGEMITPWCLAVSQKMKLSAMAQTIIPYPTYGEASKRVASAYFTPKLFGNRARFIVKWLNKLF